MSPANIRRPLRVIARREFLPASLREEGVVTLTGLQLPA